MFSWVASHRNKSFSKMLLHIRLCRDLFADHFDKNVFSISSTDKDARVKIPVNFLVPLARAILNL
jgi:hypothetical protein